MEMELLKMVSMLVGSVFMGVVVGIILSERSLKIKGRTKQILIIFNTILVIGIFKSVDGKLVEYLATNKELVEGSFFQTMVLEANIVLIVYLLLFTITSIRTNYKVLVRRLDNVR